MAEIGKHEVAEGNRCISCAKEATFDAPGLWCNQHWLEWWHGSSWAEVIADQKPPDVPESYEGMRNLFTAFEAGQVLASQGGFPHAGD